MRILLTGLTGYIGKRLLPVLLENGNEVISLVRDATRVQDLLVFHDAGTFFHVQENGRKNRVVYIKKGRLATAIFL